VSRPAELRGRIEDRHAMLLTDSPRGLSRSGVECQQRLGGRSWIVTAPGLQEIGVGRARQAGKRHGMRHQDWLGIVGPQGDEE
jgi:hypothetical protein